MRAYTWADLFTYVRDHVEADILDLPDTLLTPWFVESFNEIEGAETRWTFRWAAYDYAWVGGVAAVDTWLIANTLGTNVRDRLFDVIEGVYHPLWGRLQNASYEDMVVAKALTRETSGIPRIWALQPNGVLQGEAVYKLDVYPAPADNTTLTIMGYRRPLDTLATSVGSYPDLPMEFHLPLAYFALHLYYLQTEDIEMSATWLTMFNNALNKYGEKQDQLTHPFPVALNEAKTGTKPSWRTPYQYAR